MAHRIEFGGLFVGQPTGDGGDQRRRPASIRSIDGLPITLDGVERPVAPGQALSCPRGEGRARWREGERLDDLFEQACLRFGTNKAVVTDAFSVSYRDLDNRANQVARYLIERGVKPGDRVGLLFDKSVETYVALLAVLKANAAYVPLDPGFPTERLRFILTDAAVKTVVSMSCFESKLCDFDVQPFFLDAGKRDIDAKPSRRLGAGEVLPPVDQVCYIIYTSGTTGNPKGVVIEHPSICNFVRVAAELYGFRPGDRVYQGMTIAFDFSIEEIWVPLMAGATLVPGTPGMSLLGEELADFLEDRGVTCMACCPTLLATIERDLPRLRILLVGGEACPHNLVVRWSRPGRTILNSYGPTEATVTATLKTLTPDQPVTIGQPLPTYAIVILDPVADQAVPHGERGEIGIAGIGLAAGYLNRDELTQQKFIPDFLNLPNNPSKRIYRTGDLGRINDDGEIEYLGRIDTQVKIRGYRIELVEIESVLLEMPEVAQAVVSTFEPEPGSPELVAYYALKQGAARPSRNDVAQALRRRLPAYMVPAYLEELPFIPMSASNKADRKQLPKPSALRFQSGEKLIAAKTENERLLAASLAELLSLDNVSTEDHFFDDLGTNSLVMARFCARIRRHPGMSNASMRDIYLNPTIAKLAAHLGQASGEEPASAAAPEPFHVPSDLAYYGCGALQLLFFAVYGLLGLWLFDLGLSWADAAIDDPIALYCAWSTATGT
jgi:amino acid adenylation domain-containing protein